MTQPDFLFDPRVGLHRGGLYPKTHTLEIVRFATTHTLLMGAFRVVPVEVRHHVEECLTLSHADLNRKIGNAHSCSLALHVTRGTSCIYATLYVFGSATNLCYCIYIYIV